MEHAPARDAAPGSSISCVRQYTWWSLLLPGLALPILAVVQLVQSDASLLQSGLLLAAVALVTGHRTWLLWTLTDRPERPSQPLAQQGMMLFIATAAWSHAVLLGLAGPVWGLLPGLLVSGLTLTETGTRWRPRAAAGVALSSTALVAMLSLQGVSVVLATQIALIGAAFMAAVIALDRFQVWYLDLVVRLDEARRTAAALAVAEERLRFAADLHDTQGHYLQVIALKGELVERLMGVDEARAGQEAGEIAALARKSLADTRGLVRGYREASLQQEVDNAVGILRASSVDVRVGGEASAVPHALQPLFAALVREGTTNVLRHSAASHCEITLAAKQDEAVIRLANDRPANGRANGHDAGSGLAGLRERFAAVGGDVVVRSSEYQFEIVGRAPVPRPAHQP